jgi:hypothetical protein
VLVVDLDKLHHLEYMVEWVLLNLDEVEIYVMVMMLKYFVDSLKAVVVNDH